MSKAVEAAATLRAIVPAQDETIEHWHSVVHWTELYTVKDTGKNRGYTKWLVPVTCGRRVSPDCRGKRDVIVLRGMNGIEMLTPDCLTGRGCTYSGVCFPCLKVKTYPRLLLGSEVYDGDINEEGTLVKCGGCGTLRRNKIKEPAKLTGLCSSCGVRAVKSIPDHKHPVNHAMIYSSRPVREGSDKGKWPFKCLECGKEANAWSHQARDPKWQGLCSDCRTRRGYTPRGDSPTRVTEDIELPTGSIVCNSRREGDRVPVLCGWLMLDGKERCRREHWVHFRTARRKGYRGHCSEHNIYSPHCRRENIFAAIQAQAQNGNERKNGVTEKKPVGAPKGSHAIITPESLKRAFNQLGGYATQEAVAEFLNVTDRAIRDWQKANNLKWRQVQQQFSQTGSELQAI